MAKMSRSAEFRMGLVVLLGLVVLALGIYLVSGGSEGFVAKKGLRVFFRDAGGLAKGDTVTLAGRRAGKVMLVTEEELDWERLRSLDRDEDDMLSPTEFGGPPELFRELDTDADGRLSARDGIRALFNAVRIEVRRSDQIHVDSSFHVAKTITGIATLNVAYGTPGRLADENDLLFGRRLQNFDEMIDSAGALVNDARGAITAAEDAFLKLQTQIEAIDIPGLRAHVEPALADFEQAMDRAKAAVEDASGKIGRILDDAVALASGLKDGWNAIDPNVRGAAEKVEGAMITLDRILAENEEGVKALLQELTDVVGRLGGTLDTVERLSRSADEVVLELRPKIVATMDSARVALANFEGLTEDLKTAPWKLLRKPSGKEVHDVAIYNAARLYVAGMTRVQEAIEDLAVLEGMEGPDGEGRRQRMEEVLERLRLSLDEYGSREEEFLRLLGENR